MVFDYGPAFSAGHNSVSVSETSLSATQAGFNYFADSVPEPGGLGGILGVCGVIGGVVGLRRRPFVPGPSFS